MSIENSIILTSPQITIQERLTAIRTLSGNLDADTISDEEIGEKISRWDNWMYTMTNKFDWLTDQANLKIDQVINASNLMTSAEILNGIGDGESTKNAIDQRQLASRTVRAINAKDEDQNNFAIVGKGYNITDELDPDNYLEEQREFE